MATKERLINAGKIMPIEGNTSSGAKMNKFKNLIAVSAAALSLYSADVLAQDRDRNDWRTERRLGHPVLQEDAEPEQFSLTANAAFFSGIDGIELNHELFGYGVGGKLNLHIGLFTAPVTDLQNMRFGLEVSDSFSAIITGGLYDGFVDNINLAFSGLAYAPNIAGGWYAGTGLSFVDTIDPWGNHSSVAYGNLHAGGRLIFENYGELELEVGGMFNEADSGLYASIGFGFAAPGIEN